MAKVSSMMPSFCHLFKNFRVRVFRMLAWAREQFKIAYLIIHPIAILMVDYLRAFQWSFQVFFHNNSVFVAVLFSRHSDTDVTTPTRLFTARPSRMLFGWARLHIYPVALGITKFTPIGRVCGKLLAALFTNNLYHYGKG